MSRNKVENERFSSSSSDQHHPSSSSSRSRRSKSLSLSPSISPKNSYENIEGDDESTLSSALIVFELIEDEQWNDLMDLLQTTPKAAQYRHRVPKSVQFNLPLHEVCRRQPPVRVVNLLLDLYDEAVLMPGQYGFLPLHVACGSGARYEVVSRLLEAYPGATQCRDDTKGSLPLHLAAKWGAPEDVFMEILTTHPEGSFVVDLTGKTPLDLAKQLPDCEAKQRILMALETAPILVATAKSTARRVEREMESRLRTIQDTHTDFVRQMERRHEEEKTEFLQLEIQFHNELATEKERNCELAELILNHRKSEFKESDQKKSHMQRLESQRREVQERWETHKTGLKSALDGKFDSPLINNFEKEIKDRGSGPGRAPDMEYSIRSDNDLEQVAFLVKTYRKTQDDLAKVNGDLCDRDDIISTMKETLEKKQEEIQGLTKKLQEMEMAKQECQERLDKMSSVCRSTVQDLNSTRNEMNRLSRKCDQQQQQLEENRRRQKVQNTRLGKLRDIVSMLTTHVDTWTEPEESTMMMMTYETPPASVVSTPIRVSSTGRKGMTTLLGCDPSPIISTPVVGMVEMDKLANISTLTQDTSLTSSSSSNASTKIIITTEEVDNILMESKKEGTKENNNGKGAMVLQKRGSNH